MDNNLLIEIEAYGKSNGVYLDPKQGLYKNLTAFVKVNNWLLRVYTVNRASLSMSDYYQHFEIFDDSGNVSLGHVYFKKNTSFKTGIWSALTNPDKPNSREVICDSYAAALHCVVTYWLLD